MVFFNEQKSSYNVQTTQRLINLLIIIQQNQLYSIFNLLRVKEKVNREKGKQG